MLLLLITCFLCLPCLPAQPTTSARALDALLQAYAYRAFVRPRPRTGILYDGAAPSNLTGIKIAAIRLRSGSLRKRGVLLREFNVSTGVVDHPYVKRLVLVYQNLGNWSQTYYPLSGYTYLVPILGLLAYNASNLSATNLPDLDLRATGKPINITFPNMKPVPAGAVAKCVWFDLHGSSTFSDVVSGDSCTTTQQGHFSIVVQYIAPSPAPVSIAPSPTPVSISPSPTLPTPPPREGGKKSNSRVWIIVGSVLGGFVLLVILSFLVLWAHKLKQRKKMQKMEREAEVGETLHVASVGETKAPAATVTRTQPTLESEYVP